MPPQPCRPSLRSRTLRIGSDRFISDGRHCISIGDLRTRATIDPSTVRGRSVLLKTTAQLPTILALLELDGIASRVVLCPPDQWQHLPSIIETAAIQVVVTDEPDEGAGVPMILATCALIHPVYDERDVDTQWILLTSGTTGAPKLAIHTLSSLAGPLEDGVVAGGAIWSTFYDTRRYGGLQILLRALLGGGSMILSSESESPTQFLTRLGKRVTHISGTPSHWRRALMSPAITAMAPTYVRLSGEIADQAILDNLGRAFPGSNIAHAYASTEAGLGFDVRDGKTGFPASLIGRKDHPTELRIEGGTLHIRSSRTASGYLGGKSLNGLDGFVDTGDLVEKRGDRYYFAGRKEGVINVGGQKVHPEEVEAILTQHPDIQMARVWARTNPVVGSLVAADIMLRTNSKATLADIRNDLVDHCRRHLSAWKVPVTIRQVDSIKLSPAGKIARHA